MDGQSREPWQMWGMLVYDNFLFLGQKDRLHVSVVCSHDVIHGGLVKGQFTWGPKSQVPLMATNPNMKAES